MESEQQATATLEQRLPMPSHQALRIFRAVYRLQIEHGECVQQTIALRRSKCKPGRNEPQVEELLDLGYLARDRSVKPRLYVTALGREFYATLPTMPPSARSEVTMPVSPIEIMEASVPKKPFLTPQEVSELSGLTVQTLASKRSNRIPPDFVRAGGSRVRIPRAAIVQWLADEYVTTHRPSQPVDGRRRR